MRLLLNHVYGLVARFQSVVGVSAMCLLAGRAGCSADVAQKTMAARCEAKRRDVWKTTKRTKPSLRRSIFQEENREQEGIRERERRGCAVQGREGRYTGFWGSYAGAIFRPTDDTSWRVAPATSEYKFAAAPRQRSIASLMLFWCAGEDNGGMQSGDGEAFQPTADA